MKPIALACCLWLATCLYAAAQEKIELSKYFDWFQREAQVDKLYAHEANLYVFNPQAPLFKGPDLNAPVLARMRTGDCIISLLKAEKMQLPSLSLRGMEELWYPVRHQLPDGRWVRGWIWGGDVAKGWRTKDLDADGHPELLLLGLSASSNLHTNQIAGELKILSRGQVLSVAPVPNLCIFEACAVTPLLRLVPTRHPQGMIIVETSALHIGCQEGLNRAFFHWNGREMERVYQAEWIQGKIMRQIPFEHRQIQANRIATYQCAFSGEDEHYNPVWDCTEKKPLKQFTPGDTPSQVR